MELITQIKLSDGSIHSTRTQAERHLIDTLSRGNARKLFEELATNSALKNKTLFISEVPRIAKVLNICTELNEVLELPKNIN